MLESAFVTGGNDGDVVRETYVDVAGVPEGAAEVMGLVEYGETIFVGHGEGFAAESEAHCAESDS